MLKASWTDLLSRFPEPHIVVASLPDASEEESMSNAQSAQRLLVRVIRKLPITGEFAVTVCRQSGKREILCAFGGSSAAAVVAEAAKATKAPMSDRAPRSVDCLARHSTSVCSPRPSRPERYRDWSVCRQWRLPLAGSNSTS